MKQETLDEELKFKNRQIGAAGFVANQIMENMINKPKQETLEEDLLDTAIQVIGSNSVVTIKEFFIKNNWQSEKMYSEEDMLKCWNTAFTDAMNIDSETYKPIFYSDFINSLNKQD
jgi:uroporphyrinogen-III synthase